MLSAFLGLVLAPAAVTAKVDGEGYMRFVRDGRVVYAKEAKLTVAGGKLANEHGDPVIPTISVSDKAVSLSIDLEGNVSADLGSGSGHAGRLVLALFESGASLIPEKGVLTSPVRPKIGNPGEGTNGVIRTGSSVKGSPASGAGNPPKQDPPTGGGTGGAISGTRITFLAKAEVSGEHILLGEIATVEAVEKQAEALKAVDLGETPVHGVVRKIDRTRILGKLRAAGFKPEGFVILVPAVVEVTRKAQHIPHEKFIEVGLGAIKDRVGYSEGFETKGTDKEFVAPEGSLELRAENLKGIGTGDISVVVGVYVDGKRINSRTVRFENATPVATVKVGNQVKVVMIAGSAQVEVPGIAKTSGVVGESIQVEVRVGTPEVRTLHVGVLVAPGVVQVKL